MAKKFSLSYLLGDFEGISKLKLKHEIRPER
jgi:hypothetical protein